MAGNNISVPIAKNPLLEIPYRHEDFSERRNYKLIEEIKSDQMSLHIEEHNGRKWNLLVLGPCGSGKSSLINSVLSISKGKYINSAFACGVQMGYTTSKFRSYARGSFDNLRFYDTAGLHQGFNIDMMTSIISGRVKEGYDFFLGGIIEEDNPFYRKNPSEADMMHCVIYVVDICLLSVMDSSFTHSIRKLQTKQISSDLQRILILTKCDELCDEVNKNVVNIYRSKKVLEEINRASDLFGLPRGNIHPVVNYGERVTTINPDMNIPILLALQQCVNFSNDFMENILQRNVMQNNANKWQTMFALTVVFMARGQHMDKTLPQEYVIMCSSVELKLGASRRF
ncbi:interferon-induced protein 44-like [Ruditapes philippinarum]|uniref:interferon-induced protein 44-like n=1 Tax=Ruditapes philippinarum TaxID=129788 RepID=UPI00295B4C66|nr:interferon-induced protein 44-like [Ruditapes philippinarum]